MARRKARERAAAKPDARPAARQRADALRRLADFYTAARASDADITDPPVPFAEALAANATVEPALCSVGLPVVLEALRASDDDDAAAFLALYDSRSAADLAVLSWDAIACASGIGSKRLLEVAQSALHAYGSSLSTMLLAEAMPRIVQRSIKSALTAKGIDDRMAMLKAGAVLPIPKGSQIALQINASSALPVAPDEPTTWNQERQLRQVHEAWGARKHLPAARSGDLPPAVEAVQRKTVETLEALDATAADATVDVFDLVEGT